MNKEYIERSLAENQCEAFSDTRVRIHNLPAADVTPIVHGEWVEEFRSQMSPDGCFYWNTPQKKIYVCSICGREEIKKEPYCNCGARMDGGK